MRIRNACGQSISSSFEDPATASLSSSESTSFSQMYHELMNVERFPEIRANAHQLVEGFLAANEAPSELPLSISDDEISILSTHHLECVADFFRKAAHIETSGTSLTTDRLNFILMQYAPTAIIDGAWLHGASSVALGHTYASTCLHRIHSRRIGGGDTTQNYGNGYLDLLHSLGMHPLDASSSGFSSNSEVLSQSFIWPTFQLAIALYPKTFFPEILGMTLYSALTGIPAIIRHAELKVRESCGCTRYFDLHHEFGGAIGKVDALDASEAILSYLDSLKVTSQASPEELAQAYQRIKNGVWTTHILHSKWTESVHAELSGDRFDIRTKMVNLIREKAPYAIGYHERLKMEGCSLDEWMVPDKLDPHAFVEMLSRSRYVVPGKPEKSLLSTRLVDFGGPMFRIFSPTELMTIRQWIGSLSQKSSAVVSPMSIEVQQSGPKILHARLGQVSKKRDPQALRRSIKKYAHLSLGKLYWHLLNIERFPDILPFADQFVTSWLAKSAVGMHRGNQRIPFQHYSHANLRRWLDEKHTQQVQSYSLAEKKPQQSREQVITSAARLAPLLFIDGAWLQAAGSPAFCRSKVGAILFQIYSDEIGNGDARFNHPNIYRELMEEMGVRLPAFDAPNFEGWDGFDDEVFQVPVFWLCISQFMNRYLPEILGLNLAMELSGVGGSYRAGRDLLRHYGYDTLFVDLHNTIDNVSTGHSAMALSAIGIYMDEYTQQRGSAAMERQWARVWTGYRALVAPTGWLKAKIAGTRTVAARIFSSLVV